MGEPAPRLFSEFNGLPPDAAWSCYSHKGNWSNRIIKGHSEDVMASLAGKEDLAGQVQMIYWDPPYGIKFDATYQPSTKRRVGGPPAEASAARAFRDSYRDGIHSYLDAVYRTAVHGRALLTVSGSFFLQISSANLHRCALVLDEVFGPGKPRSDHRLRQNGFFLDVKPLAGGQRPPALVRKGEGPTPVSPTLRAVDSRRRRSNT